MTRRLLSIAILASLCILGIHLIVILFTGGYAAGSNISHPLILFCALSILWFALMGSAQHTAAILFSAFLILYLANDKTLSVGDTLPNRYAPFSLLREGNFDFNEFPFLYREG